MNNFPRTALPEAAGSENSFLVEFGGSTDYAGMKF
jgi:hypothetical protein